MKKKRIALLLTLSTLFSLSACGTTELQTKLDEMQTQINQLQSELEEKEAQIADLEGSSNRNDAIVHYIASKHKFFTLREAYDMGLLSRDELMSIAYYQNGGCTYNEEVMPEDYAPQPKQELNEWIIEQMIQERIEYQNSVHWNEENVFIKKYYGAYGMYKNCYAFATSDSYSGADSCGIDTIDDVNLWFEVNNNYIFIWYYNWR